MLLTLCWKKLGSRYLSNRCENATRDGLQLTWAEQSKTFTKIWDYTTNIMHQLNQCCSFTSHRRLLWNISVCTHCVPPELLQQFTVHVHMEKVHDPKHLKKFDISRDLYALPTQPSLQYRQISALNSRYMYTVHSSQKWITDMCMYTRRI